MSKTIAADRNEFLRFFDLLAPNEEITFQLYTDPKPLKKMGRALFFHGHPVETFDELLGLNRGFMSVCWMPNRGDLKGRREENVIDVRALYVDLDGAPLAPLLAVDIPPSVVVETSPGRYHGYWPVTNCPREDFKGRQLQLVTRFGGDPSIANVNSVMRVPGFLHQKDPDQPFLSQIIVPTSAG